MEKHEPTREELFERIRTLEERLLEAEQTLQAIQSGEVDALVVLKSDGERLYTLTGADHGYRVLIETITEGALILSSDDSVYYCNRTLGEMLGLPIQKIIGRSLDSYVAASAGSQLLELIKKSRSFGAAKGEFLMKRSDGTLLPVRVSLNNMRVEDFEGVCAVITDLSEQKRVEEELRRHRTELELLVDERTDELRQEIIERKRAEKELFETNQRLQALMRALPVGVSFSYDHTCRQITGNPAVLAQFEAKPEENLSASAPDERATGRQVRYFVNGRKIQNFELPLQRAVAENREIPPTEVEIELPSGKRWFAEASGAPILDTQGQIVGGVAVTVDITERKRAEEALRMSEEKFSLAFANNPAAIAMARLEDGLILEVNDTWVALTGYSREESIGLSSRRIWPTTEASSHFVQHLNEKGSLRGWEQEFLKKSGEVYVAQLAAQILTVGGEKVVLSTMVDITEHKRTVEALRQSEELLSLFIEHAPASLAMFDRGMRYLKVSRRWLSEYNLGDRDLNGLSHYEVFPEISDELKAIHRRALAGEILRSDGDRFERLDGSVQWLQWEVRPWHDVAGNVAGIMIFSEDISERKRAEEELRESQDELDLRFRELAENSKNLEEVNIALKVLLKQREGDQKELGEMILTNVRNLVLPYLEELRKTQLNGTQSTLVGILESHLAEITSSFTRRLGIEAADLTPTELRIAAFIRDGKPSAEIAEILCCSEKTIETHRGRIRKKLGLKSRSSNLRSHLLKLR